MACGTPVVATDDPAVREVGAEAIAYAGRDAFAQTVVRVLADPEPWSRAGLERAQVFSWHRTAALTVEVYRQALA
jgi:glycosyltransferase involved in cell wall biosynthesis